MSSTDFEELCWGLLGHLGYENVSWRKGTSKKGPTSDHGRDIECDDPQKHRDGSFTLDHWFVQAKHYKEGVPPSKLDDAIAWANAERPAALLIIASGFLSNSAKDWLETYRRENKPAYRIHVWERPQLETLLASAPELLTKFKLTPYLPRFDVLHPFHAWYLVRPPTSNLGTLFSLLDTLEEGDRDEILAFAMFEVINPRFRMPTSMDEKVGDTMLDEVSYKALKVKARKLAQLLEGGTVVRLLVTSILQDLGNRMDPSQLPRAKKNNERILEMARKEFEKTTDPSTKARYQSLIAQKEATIAGMPERQQRARTVYQLFCERVVGKLYEAENEVIAEMLQPFRDLEG